MDRNDSVGEFSKEIHSNMVDVKESIEIKYNALFKILEYINKTQNYTKYYKDLYDYKEVQKSAESIYKEIDENKLTNYVYYRDMAKSILEKLSLMLIEDGYNNIDFNNNIAITYPLSNNMMDKKVKELFKFKYEEEVYSVYAKHDKQVSFFLSCDDIEKLKEEKVSNMYSSLFY